MWDCWIYGTVEGDENVKRDKTVEFVTLLNVWDIWMRWECEIDNKTEFVRLLNIWNFWIIYNVNNIKILNLLHFWICGTVEWN